MNSLTSDGLYQVNYRDIKYPRLEFKTGELILILPRSFDREGEFLERHKKWIQRKNALIKKSLDDAKGKDLNLVRTDEEFKQFTRSTVAKIQTTHNFATNSTYFRKMKSKWGSFSSRRNLTINTLLKYLPDELIEYVIFHEMAHSLERKHNKRFWLIVNEQYEDYQAKERELLTYWFLIQSEFGSLHIY
jgi:predicted metal-dependent hydrolase